MALFCAEPPPKPCALVDWETPPVGDESEDERNPSGLPIVASSVEPYAIVHIRLERVDDVIEWKVFSLAAYERLLAAIEAGEFGPATVLETEAQLKAA